MAFSRTKAVEYIRAIAKSTNSIDLKIQAKDFKKPDGFAIRYSGFKRGIFNPDAIMEYAGKKDFYSVEEDLSRTDVSEKLYKWILFSMEAKKAKGKLILIVPAGKEDEFNTMLDWKQIDAAVVGV
jgi:hypothetical protein